MAEPLQYAAAGGLAGMKIGDYLAWWLIGNYVLVCLAYAYQGDGWRVLYWAGAILIVTATVQMR